MKRLNLHFESELYKMILELKKFLGCSTITETLRYLIRREYQFMVEQNKKRLGVMNNLKIKERSNGS